MLVLRLALACSGNPAGRRQCIFHDGWRGAEDFCPEHYFLRALLQQLSLCICPTTVRDVLSCKYELPLGYQMRLHTIFLRLRGTQHG